jgi:CubicO group peptidase (beta-lactamase class C family)
MRVLAALLATALAACAPRGLDEGRVGAVEAVAKDYVARKQAAGVVVVAALDGREVFARAYGSADLESGAPMRVDTIVRLYSMTKAVACAAALVLVDDGVLGLDDPVAKWVPEVKDVRVVDASGTRAPSRPPTVRDLMLHTAGYTYGGSGRPADKAYAEVKPLEAKDMDDFAARLGRIPLAFDPGKDWVYSISIDVVGLVVERASKMKLDRFLETRIFKPLGMVDTGFHVPAEKLGRFAANYRREKDGLKRIDGQADSKYAKPPGFCSAGGGLVGTARDYLRFLLMVEGGGAPILKPETASLMWINLLPKEAFPIYFGKQVRHGTGFGLGFSVRVKDTDWDPAGRQGEYGWGGAASTHYWVSPRDRLAVVTLEQTMPYAFDLEFAIKKPVYEAIGERR